MAVALILWRVHLRVAQLRAALWGHLCRAPDVVPDVRPFAYEGTECAICLVLFDALVPIRTTACGHTFHTTCLTRWARCATHAGRSTITCPTCRGKLSFHSERAPSTGRSARHTPCELTSVRNEQMGCVFLYSDVSGRSELVRSVYDDGLVENYVISNGREQRISVERPDGIVMNYNATDERLQSINYPHDGIAYFEGRAGFEILITRQWANGHVTTYQGDAGRECAVCEMFSLLPPSA